LTGSCDLVNILDMTSPAASAATTTATVSDIVAAPATKAGQLDGFQSTCSCGLVMASTIRVNVTLDIAQHLRWHAEVGR
jgi:hypothetical protein